VAYCRYLALAIWPSPLSVLYPHPYAPELGGEPWSTTTVIGAFAVLAALSAAALATRSRRYLAMGWLWFLGTLVPVIGLVQIGPQGLADRYTYVPLIGPFVALAWGARDALLALGARRVVRGIAAGLVLLVLAAAGAASHARAQVWHDSERLYRASLAATPRNPVLLYNLGRLMAQRGRFDDAVSSYEAALAIDPDHPRGQRQSREPVPARGRARAGHCPLPGGAAPRAGRPRGARGPRARAGLARSAAGGRRAARARRARGAGGPGGPA
jgi:tetratricopeptide (TPR) repeat protein